ncbi:MAG: InlB B-repeat-containing protein, partial [Parasporobacterium sp.]|nr:InlB B-repeat-containing protein [Parasporobacterium sp.]
NIYLYKNNNYTYLDGPGPKPGWINNTDTSYDMTELMQANGSGSYTFTVTACFGTSPNFSYSETSPKSAVYTYSEPNVVHLSWDGFKAKWNKADGATKYCLSLYKDGTEIVDKQDVGTAVQLDLAAVIVENGLGSYTFNITTYKGSETTESAMSLAKEYTTVCYKVTFSDEVGTTPAQYVESGSKAVRDSKVPVKTGYIFDDWYSDSACTTAYNFNTPVTGELTLYAKYIQHPIAANLKWNGYTAQWDAVEGAVNYIVYLYKNGVACAVSGDQVPGDTESTAASYDMSSYISQFGSGMYTFTVTTEFYGWYMESLESAHSPELYAPKDFTVTFNANGGSGTAAPVAVKENDNYTLPANPFTAPAGKKFKCWSVDGTEMAPGGTVKISGNITVKAVWETERTGWIQDKGTWDYVHANGNLAKNEWVDGYWINADGSWTYQPRGSWHLNSTGWWYG